jgi:hypothetical protein
LAVDRHWNLVTANRAVAPLIADADPKLLEPPVNVLRLSLHPQGLAPRIANLAEWREHLLSCLRQQIELSADAILVELYGDLASLPLPRVTMLHGRAEPTDFGGVVAPLQLRTGAGILALFSTTTVFGTPIDVTLSELAIDAFFPADAATAEALRQLMRDQQR